MSSCKCHFTWFWNVVYFSFLFSLFFNNILGIVRHGAFAEITGGFLFLERPNCCQFRLLISQSKAIFWFLQFWSFLSDRSYQGKRVPGLNLVTLIEIKKVTNVNVIQLIRRQGREDGNLGGLIRTRAEIGHTIYMQIVSKSIWLHDLKAKVMFPDILVPFVMDPRNMLFQCWSF